MKFGIGSKLLSVCLAFALPIVVMFVLMTRTQLGDISFTSMELKGTAYQRPLQDILEHVSRHQRLALGRAPPSAIIEARIQAEALAVTAALQRLDTADRAHGEALQFTPHGLGLRQRNEFTARGLRQKWRELLKTSPAVGQALARDQYGKLVAHVRSMITHAGDTSNLILDPDLDSYYLMDATLLALPQMEERLQQIAALVEETVATGAVDSESQARLATAAAFLREADWGRALASTNTALNEDANFHGVSPTLSPSLKPRLRAVDAAVSKLLNHLGRLASSGSLPKFDKNVFDADLDELEAATYALHRVALQEEDRLLETRVSALQRHLYLGCALAAVALLVSVLLAFALANNITRRVAHISSRTKAFAAGNLEIRVGRAGSDELGELGDSFDSMAVRIGKLTGEVQARARELEQLNGSLEATVATRTRELSRRNDAFRLILDNAHDGMLTVDLNGVFSTERSAAMERWFGIPAGGVTLPEYLGAGNPTLALELGLGLEELRSDVMPMDLILDQMPHGLLLADQHLRLCYRPILEEGRLSRLLVVVSDVTSEIEHGRASALQQETVRIFQACQRDRAGFLDFFVNAREIVESLASFVGQAGDEVARAVHTLKGNCALFGVLSMSSLCHDIEDDMADNGGILSDSAVERLGRAWGALSVTVTQMVGDAQGSGLEIADNEYSAIVDAITCGTPRREILVAIANWKLEPTARRLSRFAGRAKELASRMGKDLEISVESNGLRVCAHTWAPVWAALSHVLRNCIDHGIESAGERRLAGKPLAGRLVLRTRLSEQRLLLEVSDDGRGIPWQRLAEAAVAKGLPHASRQDLEAALFADGVSTAEQVTETSGRGVGMSAVREACRGLAGHVEIESEPGHGTTIRCSFPSQSMGGSTLRSAEHWVVAASLAPVAVAASDA